jgi:hypothetical protein
MWNINRGLGECHGRNVARTIWKDYLRLDANDQLRADRLGEKRIVAIDPGVAVDAQSLRIAMHCNEQKPDMWIDRKVAETLEHAISVIIWKR